MTGFHIVQNPVQDFLIYFHAQKAVLVGHNAVGSSRIKSGNNLPFFTASYRELGFISVAPGFLHPNDSVRLYIGKSPDPLEVSQNFVLLKFQLFFVRKELQLAASTSPCNRTSWFPSVLRRFEDLEQPGISIIFFSFHDFHFCPVTDNCVFYKKGIALRFSDTFSIMSHIFNIYRQNIIFLKFHRISLCFSVPLLTGLWFCSIQCARARRRLVHGGAFHKKSKNCRHSFLYQSASAFSLL